MRSAFLALALTLSAPVAAAQTDSLSTAGFAAQSAFQPRDGIPGLPPMNAVQIHRGGSFMGNGHDGDHRRRHRGDVFVSGWNDGDWAYYNNRSWEPDSYNDWWHDRPDRAYPAWMRRNRDCQRQWYSADTLVC